MAQTGTPTRPCTRGLAIRQAALLSCATLLGWTLSGCAPSQPVPPPSPPPAAAAAPTPTAQTFTATAYSIDGTTASGAETRPGIVAADPRVLPLGSRIRISGAGQYSGVYTVADTGRAIKGRDVDIYIASDAEAKRFGKKTVTVEMLAPGDGRRDGKAVADGDGAPADPTR